MHRCDQILIKTSIAIWLNNMIYRILGIIEDKGRKFRKRYSIEAKTRKGFIIGRNKE